VTMGTTTMVAAKEAMVPMARSTVMIPAGKPMHMTPVRAMRNLICATGEQPRQVTKKSFLKSPTKCTCRQGTTVSASCQLNRCPQMHLMITHPPFFWMW